MSQQVNLYHPILRRRRPPFSALAMAQSVAVVLAAVLMGYGYMAWQVAAQRQAADTAQAQLARASERLAAAARALAQAQDPTLADTAAALEHDLSERRLLVSTLEHHAFGSRGGYSDFLIAFARQHVRGLWLTGLDIAGAGTELTVRGRSASAELVPRYLQRLGSESALAGREFASFSMRRGAGDAESASPLLDFTVSTGAG